MAQVAWAETDPTTFGGVFSVNPDTGNLVLALQAVFLDTQTRRKDIIPEIRAEIPTGSTLLQVRNAVVAAVKAKGAEYGYPNITTTLIPDFQVVSG